MGLETQGSINEDVSSSKKGEDVCPQTKENLSNVLVATEKMEFIEDLAAGRLIGEAFDIFLTCYGYQRGEQVKIKEFEENLEEFKMTHSGIRHIIY